jgi:hypothetical protein
LKLSVRNTNREGTGLLLLLLLYLLVVIAKHAHFLIIEVLLAPMLMVGEDYLRFLELFCHVKAN